MTSTRSVQPDVVPAEAYVAALAGFQRMSLHRLGALLRHHEPKDAWRVALGEVPAAGLVARVLAQDGVRAAWRRRRPRSISPARRPRRR